MVLGKRFDLFRQHLNIHFTKYLINIILIIQLHGTKLS